MRSYHMYHMYKYNTINRLGTNAKIFEVFAILTHRFRIEYGYVMCGWYRHICVASPAINQQADRILILILILILNTYF